jgi:hypothetical protein
MSEKIIVAVHGVGDQFSYETIQAVARQFCRFEGATGAVPLGRYYSTLKPPPPPYIRPGYMVFTQPPDPLLPGYGFAEIYWANVPRPAVQDGRVIEETKKWAKTIVERIRAQEKARNRHVNLWIKLKCLPRNLFTKTPPPLALGRTEYQTIKEVLGEMIETVAILERLAKWLEGHTRFRFPITRLLRNYVDDVQVVTEYRQLRESILKEFKDVMTAILAQNPKADIYIIAHSEGTVIAFLALLDALIAPGTIHDPTPWIAKVKGFMTFGSPIDKHLILWPELWDRFEQVKKWRDLKPIPWCNYYDYGDPIGFSVDIARDWLSHIGCTAITIAAADDIGFSRYLLPGKAHVDYWCDDEVFRHFIKHVVVPDPNPAPVPASALSVRIISFAVPYLAVAAITMAGTYLLYKTTAGVLKNNCGACELARNVSVLALTLFAATASARIPRLARKPWTWLLAFSLAAGAACLPLLTSAGFKETLSTTSYGTFILSATGVMIAVMGWISGVIFPRAGMIPMLAAGAAGIIAIMVCILAGHQRALWPVVSTGTIFLYLWWLAALVFDLSFVWHRYIRMNTGLERTEELMNGKKTSRNFRDRMILCRRKLQ